MPQLRIDRKSNRDDSLFKRSAVTLLDDQQWLYIQKRYHMSPRELQIATLVCRGFNNDEIARSLKIKHGTVKTHLRNIYRRVRVKSKISLLLRFIEDVKSFYIQSRSISTTQIAIVDKGDTSNITPIKQKES